MPAFPDFGALPRAYGGAVVIGRLRAEPEDFQVREWLGFEADGEGPHWLLSVRKRGANTQWVARELAKQAGVHPRDVGFAGLKDRHAVTEQAFTVPASAASPESWVGFAGEGFTVTAAKRHRRKLKRGAHKGNDFRIVIRDWAGDAAQLKERLRQIELGGVPNYFGSQRFGREGANLTGAALWFDDGKPPADRLQRGFVLSAARSALFNTVLASRIARGTWNRLEDGDVANLDGSGSIFAVPVVDDTLRERCERLDVHPTGPLWGRGEIRASGAVAELERAALQPWATWLNGLSSAGLEQERRALRLRVDSLRWENTPTELVLDFRLGRGAFATAVLAEILAPAQFELSETDDV